MFSLNLYKENLSTDVFGQSIKYYPQLDSTNTKAWELIPKIIENGTVVITDNQTGGRGRQANKWISIQERSLTFSIIMYPNALPNQINLYSLIAGLAITDCLIEYDIHAQLKWPNDILINGKKVGGILCESKISGGVIKSMVIGIGLNVNETIAELPKEVHYNATSLMIESGKQYQAEILLANILNQLEHRIQDKNNIQLTNWEERCAHLNQRVTFRSGNENIKGVFKGLSSIGQAVITINNEEVIFDSGEIV
jgi:BirA family transcriptional regulator, biotin operon repressor / biotin---[acetyl-CoA-carboxylase] ligase